MRILITTDAWAPQVNGVVRTLHSTRVELERLGHEVRVVSPDLFRSVACPTYPEIRLAAAPRPALTRLVEDFRPDVFHIATEGPLGMAMRRWCLGRGLAFTTAYHTQFPEYVARRTGLPASWFWRYIAWFHRPAAAILVSTPTVAAQLGDHGLPQTRLWGRGVDLDCFRPDAAPHPQFRGLARPVLLYVGRIAVEKNIEAFLSVDHPGSKIVVGDGPQFAALKRRYPKASFLGALKGDVLASAYRAADVLVFPSRTDTFGLVMIEALACGTPVAGFPVPGPLNILNDEVGAMSDDLGNAIALALTRDRGRCARYGRGFSWKASAEQFASSLVPLSTPEPGRHRSKAWTPPAAPNIPVPVGNQIPSSWPYGALVEVAPRPGPG